MPIKKWHYGKLVILWGWTILLIGLLLKILEKVQAGERTLSQLTVILLMGGLLITMSVVTWKWLTGNERN